MLRSCSLTPGSSIPLDRQHSLKSLQRACSSSLDSLPSPASLRRLPSAPVQAPAPVTLSFTSDQLTEPRLRQLTNEDLLPGPVSRMAVTMSPAKPRTAQEFKANFGTAVRTLREDIPCTLQRSPKMDIFADNVFFTDNISPRLGHQTNTVQGHEGYSRQMWSLRFHAALLFSKSHVEMQRMWQRDDKTLAVRWNVQGSPRLIGGMTGGKVRLDGISEYKFNDGGKVCRHTVDVINWNGLHSVLGLKSLQLSSKLMPTPSCSQ